MNNKKLSDEWGMSLNPPLYPLTEYPNGHRTLAPRPRAITLQELEGIVIDCRMRIDKPFRAQYEDNGHSWPETDGDYASAKKKHYESIIAFMHHTLDYIEKLKSEERKTKR